MAKPDDLYNPVPSVAPQTGSGDDTLSVRASPASFGAQTGQALQGLSGTVDKLGDETTNYLVQRQGQINETLANNADMSLTVKGGEIYNKYKNLSGLDAVAGKDAAIQDYLKLHDDIRGGLPSDAARRAFDQVATRSTAYTIRDMDSYAAGQQKQAHTASLTASAGLALDSISRPDVALDSNRFGYAIGTMKSQLIGAFTADTGYASVTHMDAKTGDISFDSTPSGDEAKAQWTSYYNKYLGKAWENKLDVEAFDPVHGNVTTAVQDLENNRDKMPADAYARIAAKLTGPYKNAQMGQLSAGAVSDAETGWQGHIAGTGQPATVFSPQSFVDNPQATLKNILGTDVVITSGVRLPEHNVTVGGVPTSEHIPGKGNAWDFNATGLSTHETALQLAQRLNAQGIKFDQIIDEGNHVHVGFGPSARGEVLQGGPGHYSKLDVPATHTTVPGGPQGGQNYINKADYIDANMGNLLSGVYKDAQARFPDRPDLWEQASRTAETQLTNIVREQRTSVKSEGDTILDAAISGKYTHGVPVTSLATLDAIPELANQWHDYQLQAGPFGVNTVQRILASNARGQANTFGTNFYGTLSKVMNGTYKNINDVATDLTDVDPKHQPLTNTGFKLIKQIMDGSNQDPSTKAFYTQAYNWINSPQVRGSITASGLIPGVTTHAFDQKFETALMDVMPKLMQGKAQGLSLQQMTNPKSKDYVGGAFEHAVPTMAERLAVLSNQALNGPAQQTPTGPKPVTQFDPSVIKTPQDLASNATKLTKEQYNNIAIRHGWMKPSPPPVPLEH